MATVIDGPLKPDFWGVASKAGGTSIAGSFWFCHSWIRHGSLLARQRSFGRSANLIHKGQPVESLGFVIRPLPVITGGPFHFLCWPSCHMGEECHLCTLSTLLRNIECMSDTHVLWRLNSSWIVFPFELVKQALAIPNHCEWSFAIVNQLVTDIIQPHCHLLPSFFQPAYTICNRPSGGSRMKLSIVHCEYNP